MYATGNKEGREQVAFMLHVLTPDCVFETIFEITPAFLQKRGIRGALIDIDGTASSHRMRLPSEELCAYVDSLKKAGIIKKEKGRILIIDEARLKALI